MSITKEDENMPGRDRTGPMSNGPLTGRGLGDCKDNEEISKATNGQPARMGLRRNLNCNNKKRGCGRGFGRALPQPT